MNPISQSSRRLLHRVTALMACVLTAVGAGAADDPQAAGWKILSSIPDPTGYAGMFAGVLGGRLVAGGGSQWDRPIWLKGQRQFSDRILTLTKPDGAWTEATERLPERCGYFACAATGDAIYLAGGVNPKGCVRTAWVLRLENGKLVHHPLPDLPRPLGYACGVVAAGRFWVMGGLPEFDGKVASREVWSLDLGADGKAGWRREADLPGPGVYVATAAIDGPDIFFFGGVSFDALGKPAPSREAYHLNTADRSWRLLPALPEARVGAACPAPVLAGRRIFLIGGYGEIFPGAQRDHPGFPPQTLYYDIAARTWGRGPLLPVTPVPDRDKPGDPGPTPMLGAPAVTWQGYEVVIGGEVRPSVRSPEVVAWPSAEPLTAAPGR